MALDFELNSFDRDFLFFDQDLEIDFDSLFSSSLPADGFVLPYAPDEALCGFQSPVPLSYAVPNVPSPALAASSPQDAAFEVPSFFSRAERVVSEQALELEQEVPSVPTPTPAVNINYIIISDDEEEEETSPDSSSPFSSNSSTSFVEIRQDSQDHGEEEDQDVEDAAAHPQDHGEEEDQDVEDAAAVPQDHGEEEDQDVPVYYVVKRILHHRIDEETGEVAYRVQWKGYSHLTWEPEENLYTADGKPIAELIKYNAWDSLADPESEDSDDEDYRCPKRARVAGQDSSTN
jgi:hypothetical protein